MGTGMIPEVLDQSLYKEALRVHSDEAISMAKRLATEEAIFAGTSSGANVCAAIQVRGFLVRALWAIVKIKQLRTHIVLYMNLFLNDS